MPVEALSWVAAAVVVVVAAVAVAEEIAEFGMNAVAASETVYFVRSNGIHFKYERYLLKLPDEQGFADLQHVFAVVDSDVVVEAADAESVPAEEGSDEETGPLVQLVVVDFETVGDPLS